MLFAKITLLFIFGLVLLLNSLSINATHAQITQQQSQQLKEVKITSPEVDQQVNLGKLTIFGTSTDNASTDCTIYADWNNLEPFQKANAAGPGGINDFSVWNFTYTQDYHLITNGPNNLTVRLICLDNPFSIMSDSVYVSGLSFQQNQPATTTGPTQPPTTTTRSYSTTNNNNRSYSTTNNRSY